MVLNNIIFGESWNKFTRKWRETVGLCSQSNPDSLSRKVIEGRSGP